MSGHHIFHFHITILGTQNLSSTNSKKIWSLFLLHPIVGFKQTITGKKFKPRRFSLHVLHRLVNPKEPLAWYHSDAEWNCAAPPGREKKTVRRSVLWLNKNSSLLKNQEANQHRCQNTMEYCGIRMLICWAEVDSSMQVEGGSILPVELCWVFLGTNISTTKSTGK